MHEHESGWTCPSVGHPEPQAPHAHEGFSLDSSVGIKAVMTGRLFPQNKPASSPSCVPSASLTCCDLILLTSQLCSLCSSLHPETRKWMPREGALRLWPDTGLQRFLRFPVLSLFSHLETCRPHRVFTPQGFQRSDWTPDAKSPPERTNQHIGYQREQSHREPQEVTITRSFI